MTDQHRKLFYAGLWCITDGVDDYFKRIWRRVVKAGIDELKKQGFEDELVPFFCGTTSAPWVQQRWRHRWDVDGVFFGAPSRVAAQKIAARLRSPEVPGTLEVEYTDRSPEQLGLALDGWQWKGVVLQFHHERGSRFESHVKLPMLYLRDEEEGLLVSHSRYDEDKIRALFEERFTDSVAWPKVRKKS